MATRRLPWRASSLGDNSMKYSPASHQTASRRAPTFARQPTTRQCGTTPWNSRQPWEMARLQKLHHLDPTELLLARVIARFRPEFGDRFDPVAHIHLFADALYVGANGGYTNPQLLAYFLIDVTRSK